MLKIFHSQCSVRSKGVLTSSQFTKLANFTGMTNDKITKNDYHLIFIKIMRNKFNQNQMEFEDFIDALEYIVKEIVGYTKENKLEVMRDHIDFLVHQLHDEVWYHQNIFKMLFIFKFMGLKHICSYELTLRLECDHLISEYNLYIYFKNAPSFLIHL